MAAQAQFDNSNIANLGGSDNRAAKLEAAKSSDEWKGAGEKVGIQVWRIENFSVKPWDEKAYGTFYSGDSYIVLNTYTKPESRNPDAIHYNVHFWLGESTTQDELGTAAYKTVELDDLLGDLPVQYREVQGEESEEFLKMFDGRITILEGGIESAFRNVQPEEYKACLLHIKNNNGVRVTQVPLDRASLNMGDCFVLDNGLMIWQWNGTSASFGEKQKALAIVRALKDDRNGRPKSTILDGDEDDDEFWNLLGGKGPIADAIPDVAAKKPPVMKKLFRFSDASGVLEFTEEADGDAVISSALDSKDVFVVDLGHRLYLWIGSQTSKPERQHAFENALEYLRKNDRPEQTPIRRVVEGGENDDFWRSFKDHKVNQDRDLKKEGKTPAANTLQDNNGTANYLTYEDASNGCLFLNWKADASDSPDGAVALFYPQKNVPKFKFKSKGGRDELTRGCESKRINFFQGWVNYVKLAHSYKGKFKLLQEEKVGLYFLYGTEIHRVQIGAEYDLFNKKPDVVAAIVHNNSQVFDGALNMSAETFLQRAQESTDGACLYLN